jgi:hypothetical protein
MHSCTGHVSVCGTFHVCRCTWRFYDDNNKTLSNARNLYALEMYLHEAMLQSEHR